MRLVWLSDLHLEVLATTQVRAFLAQVVCENPDAVLITGDISNARLLEYHLSLLAELIPCPIYFVLGNHDFYLGNFALVDALVANLCARHPNLIQLGNGEIIPLGPNTAMIGHRGWADGRAGVGNRSTIRLNDHQYITDLREPDPNKLFTQLNSLGDESADYLRRIAPKALEKVQNLIIATHVPPFVEAALYQNKASDPAYAPHFVNLALGRAVLDVARNHPDKTLSVFCGHTHHPAVFSPETNLTIEVAGAVYSHPQVAGILTVS